MFSNAHWHDAHRRRTHAEKTLRSFAARVVERVYALLKSMRAGFLSLVCSLCLVACSTVQLDQTLVGRYAPTRVSYSPLWLELLADGKFVLTSNFDVPVPGGEGPHGNEIIEKGRWQMDGKTRLLLTVAKKKIAATYYVTIMTDTPRGPGIFVSSQRDEPAIWQSIDRFLTKEDLK